MNTNELFATIEAGLNTGWYAADRFDSDKLALTDGIAALATLRQSHDYDISQHISGALGDLFDDEGLFVETTPSIELVDRMVKEIKTLRQRATAMQAAIDEWESVNGTASMDEALRVCEALAKFATRNQVDKQERQ